jgi:hypothetical protein
MVIMVEVHAEYALSEGVFPTTAMLYQDGHKATFDEVGEIAVVVQ